MKKIPGIIILALLVCIVAFGINCVLKKKVVEIVITDELCVAFSENHAKGDFITPGVIDYSVELDKILADNGLVRSDIIKSVLVSASYEVTDFANTHDWEISGSVSVQIQDATDGPESIIDYTSQTIPGTLGKKMPAILNTAGVALLNRAFDDYCNGGNPVLLLTANNASVDPSPDSGDPIVFDWSICLVIHIVVKEEIEIPDPF